MFLVRILLTAAALWLTDLLIEGVTVRSFGTDTFALVLTYVFLGTLFTLVWVTLGKIIKIIALPLYLITLGLISFPINGALFMFVASLSSRLNFGLNVDSFFTSVLAAFFLSLLTSVLSVITGTKRKRKRKR